MLRARGKIHHSGLSSKKEAVEIGRSIEAALEVSARKIKGCNKLIQEHANDSDSAALERKDVILLWA